MPLNPKQQRFCDEYLKDFNATQAAIRSGYSARTAAAIGSENLTKPDIKNYLHLKANELSLSSEETLLSLTAIARASLNKHFRLKEVVQSDKYVISLYDFIASKRCDLEDLETVFEAAREQGLITAGDDKIINDHNYKVKALKLEIIALEVELKRKPNATRVVKGDAYVTEVAHLDMVSLVKDKEAGRIKSVKYNENGPQVELYAADGAIRDFIKIHGLFEKDNKQKTDITVGFDEVNEED